MLPLFLIIPFPPARGRGKKGAQAIIQTPLQLPLSLLSSALGLASQLVGLALGLADDLVSLALRLAGELAGLALGLALDLGGGARVLRAREDVLADFLGLLGDGG